MAEGNPSILANHILRLLRSEDIKELVPYELLKEIESKISTLPVMLLEAEKKSARHNHYIKDWLKRIEDGLNDADNLLEDLATLALRRRSTTSGTGNKTFKLNQQVCRFFSSSNPTIPDELKVTNQINEIKKIIEVIQDGARNNIYLNLGEHGDRCGPIVRRETCSVVVNESDLVSRVDDKMAIMAMLFDMEFEKNVTVLPIVGMGGIGKTTFAKTLFNDERVKEHFELRIWVTVSQDFDIKDISRQMVRSMRHHENTGDLSKEALQRLLRDTIDGKRNLVVFDDVWNENASELLSLMSILPNGARGSTIPPYFLPALNQDQSWTLFKRMAFHDGEEPEGSWKKEIGMEIVNKCQGNPLAIKEIGALLRYKNLEADWRYFCEHKLLILQDESYGCRILAALQLSYDSLPTHLRHCFAYCSLFPKDNEFDVQTMIKLWMAQGFIESQIPGKSLEDAGYLCFLDLFQRSFFQESERDSKRRVKKFRMHNLMHDLAIHVAGKQCATLSSGTNGVDQSTSHVSFASGCSFSAKRIPTMLIHAEKIRSILMPSQSFPEDRSERPNKICNFIVSRFRLLRMLDMHALGITIVPNSIGNLNLLKYLDLSENDGITELPNSITKLVNLQTLRLSSCFKLKKLPKDITNLVDLRHLEIDGCYNLAALPQGIGQLTNLQTLSQLILSDEDSTRREDLKVLKGLNYLEEFELKNLRHGMDDMASFLNEIPEVQSLSLEWESRAPKSGNSAPLNIELLSRLKELELIGFWGETLFYPGFPTNLVRLCLSRWVKGKNLEPLEQCFNLKELVLHGITDLEYVVNEVDIGTFSSARMLFFPSLEELVLLELPNLRGWWKSEVLNEEELPSFPRLSTLVIEDCPKLASMPLFPTLEEGLVLDSTCWNPFQLTMKHGAKPAKDEASSSTSQQYSSPLSKLKNMSIVGINEFDDFKANEIFWNALGSLQKLKFDFLPELTTLPEGVQHVTRLEELHVWRCGVMEIPDWIGELKALKKLVIRVCPRLEKLPEAIHAFGEPALEIEGCPKLKSKKEIRADWDKIEDIEPEPRLEYISRRS